MMNAYAERSGNLPPVTWIELLNELVASSPDISFTSPINAVDVRALPVCATKCCHACFYFLCFVPVFCCVLL